MGCCSGFARLLLIIFNFIFWLSGAALLGIGIWILVDPEIDDYQEVIEDASSDGDFLEKAAYILIGFGAFVFLVGFCGCCGAIRKSKCLLGMYIFFLVVVFAGEIAAIAYTAVHRGDVEDDLEEGLKKSIKDHYVGGLRKAWDEVQEGLDCCGGTGPDDYNGTDFQNNPNGNLIPPSCCVLHDGGQPVNQVDCQKRLDSDAYHMKGCKTALTDWIDDNSYIVIGVGAGIAALQIVIFICAVCYCRHMEEEKYSS